MSVLDQLVLCEVIENSLLCALKPKEEPFFSSTLDNLVVLSLIFCELALHLCNFFSFWGLSGYSGPLKNIPREKFNTTVIPKSYCSPWTEALGGIEEDQNALINQMVPHQLQPANYRSFNR